MLTIATLAAVAAVAAAFFVVMGRKYSGKPAAGYRPPAIVAIDERRAALALRPDRHGHAFRQWAGKGPATARPLNLTR